MIIECDKCGVEFIKKPSQVKRSKKHFCSKECREVSVEIACHYCGRAIKKQPHQLKEHNFCNRECLSNHMKNGKRVNCKACGKDLYRTDSDINSNSTGLFFCDNSCKSNHFKKSYKVTCVECNEVFDKNPAEQKRYPVHCCSVECRSIYNNRQIIVACQECGKNISRPPSLLAGRDNLFCSTKCHDIFQDTKITVACKKCGKMVSKSPVYVRRSKWHFCSNECKGQFWFNGNVLEAEFEKLVSKLQLKYSRNNRTILWDRIGQYIFPNKRHQRELDFYFPELEYAVEINGNSHYCPVYGKSTLHVQQKKDREKKQMCKVAGIKLRSVKIDNPDAEVIMRKYKRVIWEIKQHLQGALARSKQ